MHTCLDTLIPLKTVIHALHVCDTTSLAATSILLRHWRHNATRRGMRPVHFTQGPRHDLRKIQGRRRYINMPQIPRGRSCTSRSEEKEPQVFIPLHIYTASNISPDLKSISLPLNQTHSTSIATSSHHSVYAVRQQPVQDAFHVPRVLQHCRGPEE